MSTHCLPGDSRTSPVSPLPLTLEDVTNFMTKRARELVEELVKQRGREEPPFLAEELAPLQGIKEIIKTDLGDFDATLFSTGDGYIMKINAAHPPVRQNFSCAHEIGHTFLHELDLQVGTDNAEFRMSTTMSSKSEERLCNVAAAELLMPEVIFRKYLLGFGVSVNSIDRLAHIFRVSPPAAAIRIEEVSIEPCITIIWKRAQKVRCKGKGFMAKLNRKDVYIRDPSALLKAYETDSPVKSFKSFEINNVKKHCSMESKGFGHDKTRYVLSLVFPDRHGK